MYILNKIQKELKAPKNQKNSFGGYKYRSCEDILEAVKPLLEDAIITISDEIVCIGNNNPVYHGQFQDKKGNDYHIQAGEQRFYIKATATITDKDGKKVSCTAYARESFDKKGMDEAQITGSASSYARKYALNGLLLIDDTKDADSTNKHGKDTITDAQLATLREYPGQEVIDRAGAEYGCGVRELARKQADAMIQYFKERG